MHAKINWAPAAMAALAAVGGLLTPALAQVRIRSDAVLGEPFGVGRLSIEMDSPSQPDVLGIAGLGLSEKNHRVVYPALDQRPFRTLLREVLGGVGQRATIYFLFRGDAPLELVLEGRAAHDFRVTPRNDPKSHDRMLGAWWMAYAPPPRLLEPKSDYPPILQSYLRPMLARRLNFVMPPGRRQESWQDQLDEEVGLLLGTESIRIAIQQDRMLGRAVLSETADRPLPAPINPPELILPQLPERVTIEPIAMRVPEECLYIRFANISNFLWFREQLQRWSGDLSNLVSLRGLDYEPIKRTEHQLCLRQTTLSKMLGATVSGLIGGTAVADVAIVGTDTFQREGAAIGVLLQGRAGDLLGREIRRQRAQAVKAIAGVKEQTIDLGGHKVSFLSTPDNSVRSFYAVDGDYHFVTTSKTLARRFFQTRSGAGSLGASKEFRHARSLMPVARDDTALVYLSDAFFRNLTGPKYRVEMTRRLQALADVDLARMAVLAAACEGKPGASLEELIAGRFLPPGFGPRPDGSRTMIAGGDVVDSLRGRRGSFLPVPDVELTRVTPSEARAYARFAEHYRSEWGRVDPMMIALKRRPLGANRETVVIDARVSPLGRRTYDWLAGWVGPADKRQLAPVAGDVVCGEVVLQGERLFVGIRDVNPPDVRIGGGRIEVAATFAGGFGMKPPVVGYLGSYGEPGLLGLLDGLVAGAPDPAGYAGFEGGLWRRQFDRFTVYSFQREVLARVTPQLKFETSDRPAQLRARIGDVSQGKLAPLVSAWGTMRTRRTSLGNIRLVHALEQQLHVPGEDCRSAAELLLGAKLICPLRGKYVYQEAPEGLNRWTSTAFDGGGRGLAAARVPEGFQPPPLSWFRGLVLAAELNPREVSVHAEVQMQLGPPEMSSR